MTPPLLEHLRHLARWAGTEAQERAGLLLNELGYHLRQVADLAGARQAFERALAIFETFLGPDHPNTQIVRRNLEGLS